jgi:hypothetical protein
MRFRLTGWLALQDAAPNGIRLLHHMGQLMRQQLPAFVGPWREAALVKHDVVSDCIRMSIDLLRRPPRRSVGMHPHLTEIMAESRLEEGARVVIERLTVR